MSDRSGLGRRTLIFGGLAAAVGAAAVLRPRDQGANHNTYFQSLSGALDGAAQATPTLVVDADLLKANVATLRAHIQPSFHYRVVAKSLPAMGLLREVMAAADTRRLMLFHQPFINRVASEIPDANILLGKPMPVAAARNFYRNLNDTAFNPDAQLTWLVDTPERLSQYAALADSLGRPLRICLEINVGLERGGISSAPEMTEVLQRLQASERLQFAGLMGYEPHIVKVPGDTLKYRDRAMQRYRDYLQQCRDALGSAWPEQPILNAGGSPTYQLYDEGDYPFNELAAGSCLVKPTDFDLPTLADHRPASFIATPVLKVRDSMELPELPLGGLQSLWDPNRAQSFFTYGGYWKALPESPRGLRTNGLYGRSTNQELLNGSHSIALRPDDWVFLRPTQSEFVFLQFGDIAVYRDGAISERWPVFHQGGNA